MTNSIQLFEYEGQTVEFDFGNDSIMVNATEMAKIFGKEIKRFNDLETTKSFIKNCLNGRFKRPLSVEKEEDLIITRPRSGTWMHRVLALKFAAWLDSEFEIWVYITIDQIMFGSLREDAKTKAKLKEEREEVLARLLENEDYQKLMGIDAKDKEIKGKIDKQMKNQLSLFA
jgi:KilA-N domain